MRDLILLWSLHYSAMQLDKRKSTAPSVNQMAFDMMIEDQRRPAPYRLAPAAATTTSTSAAAGYPPSSTFTRSLTPLSHLDGYGRKSTDTPLSMYAMHRAKYKMTVLSSLLSPRQHSQTVQVYMTLWLWRSYSYIHRHNSNIIFVIVVVHSIMVLVYTAAMYSN